MAERQITGWHVFIGFTAAFGVIIGVNLLLAWSAVSTFPGLEVKNGYIASQTFNDRKAAQEALGWSVHADFKDGLLALTITDSDGLPAEISSIDATLGRPTHIKDDVKPDFRFDGTSFVAPMELAAGNWNIRLTAVAADGTKFQQRVVLYRD